jgi:hypothetical protein
MEKSNEQYFKELDRNITTEYKNFQKRYNKYDKIDKNSYNTDKIDTKYYYNDDTYNLIKKDLEKLNKILDKKHIKEHIILGIKKTIKTSSEGGLEWDEYYKINYIQLIYLINLRKNYLTNMLNNRMTKEEYDRHQRKQRIPEKFRKRIL